ALDAELAEFLPPMRDDFGVRARGEAVAERAQLVPQRHEVVDLSVERDLHGAVLAGHRLIARREVDDAEARYPEANPALDVIAPPARPSMVERPHHALEPRAIGPLAHRRHKACDPAHRARPRARGWRAREGRNPSCSAGSRGPGSRAPPTSPGAAAAP